MPVGWVGLAGAGLERVEEGCGGGTLIGFGLNLYVGVELGGGVLLLLVLLLLLLLLLRLSGDDGSVGVEAVDVVVDGDGDGDGALSTPALVLSQLHTGATNSKIDGGRLQETVSSAQTTTHWLATYGFKVM